MTTLIKNRQCEEALEKYGLNKKEAGLYLASLDMGEANMSDLAKKAGIKRSSAYLIFKTLEQKGLMGSFKMKKGLRFVATPPEAILSKAKTQLEELEDVLPQLKNIASKADSKTKITFYEGVEGYKIAMNDSLKKHGDTLLHIGSLPELHKIVGEDYDLNYYIPNRLKNNINLKAIYPFDISDKVKKRDHTRELREIKYLPEKYAHNATTLVYGDNKVAITSAKKELITIIIESEEIATSEKAKFNLIWDLLG